jgi:hypothetical protein
MNKNTLILLGVGAAAIYFLTRRKRPDYSGLVSVESPQPITEQEFEAGSGSGSGGSLLESVQNIAQKGGQIIQTIRDNRAQRKAKDMIFLPNSSIPTGMTRQQLAAFIKRKKREEERKKRQQARSQRKAQRQAKRTARPKRQRRRKVGEIDNNLF